MYGTYRFKSFTMLPLKRGQRLLLLAVTALVIVWLMLRKETEPPYIADEILEQACRHPDLDYMNPLVSRYVKDLGELKCSPEKNWVEIRDGNVMISPHAIRNHRPLTCDITFFERTDDYGTHNVKNMLLTHEDDKKPLLSDFFNVECKSESGQTWKNVMAGVARNEEAVKRARNSVNSAVPFSLNVLMFGMDSMSHMHFRRKLPKTYDFLTNTLNAVVLKGYNIVGDGTTYALLPILTGYTEKELPETRWRIPNSQRVDVYPFAWKNFTSNGYVTAYAEEQPQIGTFTFRFKGFKFKPTDHYMRPFFIEVGKTMSQHNKYCLGEEPRHKVMMDWMERFFDAYSDLPKFGFCFLSELSHDDFNTIGYADLDIETFLKSLLNSGKLDDTLLIVMSDHGHRFASIRSTQQGKLEERMPFFSIVVPPWLEREYPLYAKNLRTNSDRLVTPFDIHATLMSLLDFDVPAVGKLEHRGISLFSEIPKERSCASATIEPHWCACLAWSEISTEDDFAYKLGTEVVHVINKLTDEIRSQCEELQLLNVTRLEKMIPNEALLKFQLSADMDGRRGYFSDNTKVLEVFFQVQLLVSPSNGLYEALVQHNVETNSFIVKEEDLSRVNTYHLQDHCIKQTYQGLGKYCYCRVQLSSIL